MGCKLCMGIAGESAGAGEGALKRGKDKFKKKSWCHLWFVGLSC